MGGGTDKEDKIDALVLAGSRPGETDAGEKQAGVSCKAFAPVAGRPMIERVLQVLLGHPAIGRIDVALRRGPDIYREVPGLTDWAANGSVRIVDPGGSPARTVGHILSELETDRRLLVTTADHALLSTEILDQFLCQGRRAGADACAGLLPLELLESRYPDMKRTGLRLRDGRYSGCNLFLLRAGPGARSLSSFWQRLEALRKSPWRMAKAVGPLALLQYGLKLMTLRQALDRIGGKAGARLEPVFLDIPEAAIDVDTAADLAFVEKLLR